MIEKEPKSARGVEMERRRQHALQMLEEAGKIRDSITRIRIRPDSVAPPTQLEEGPNGVLRVKK